MGCLPTGLQGQVPGLGLQYITLGTLLDPEYRHSRFQQNHPRSRSGQHKVWTSPIVSPLYHRGHPFSLPPAALSTSMSLLVETLPHRNWSSPPWWSPLPARPPGPQHQVPTLGAPLASQTQTKFLAPALDAGPAGTSPDAAARAFPPSSSLHNFWALPLTVFMHAWAFATGPKGLRDHLQCAYPEKALPGPPWHQPGAGCGGSPPDVPGSG